MNSNTNLNIVGKIEIAGNTLMVNDKNIFYILHEHYRQHEKEELKFINKNIKKGDNVIDLGANIGYYTILMSKLVGDEGKVFSFEPDPNSAEILKMNIDLNDCKNVIIVQKAVHNETNKVKFYICDTDNRNNSMYMEYNDSIEVESIKLDDYFKDYTESITFIKMDIQGSEVNVLKGMQSLLQKNRNLVLVTEIFPQALTKAGTTTDEYMKIIQDNGFKIFNSDGTIADVNILTKNEYEYKDIICVKSC